ncbi:MAG: T9SS type A sorting domain-containing protein [Bacteroidota bacterium]
MKPKISLLLLFFSSLFNLALSSAQSRDKDPVVVLGSQIPSLSSTSPADLVGFRWINGGWDQVPIQVDERVLRHVRTPYGLNPGNVCLQPSGSSGAWDVWFYADSQTNVGPDSDPNFDGDDELVFMYFDTGEAFTGGSCPAGVLTSTLVELIVSDPLQTASPSYLYLFQQDGSLPQDAGADYVDYQFVLANGDLLSEYDECAEGGNCNGNSINPQCEASTVVTDDYQVAFSKRWVEDVLRITSGNATGQDILDAHQGFVAPSTEIEALGGGSPNSPFGPCGRTENTFSGARGAIVTSTDGPVRAIRSVMGSNSGTFNELTIKFTQSRADYRLDFRVHNFSNAPCAGFVDAFDLNETARGNMTYFNDRHPSGFTVDGNPDVLADSEVRDWELVRGIHGAIAATYDYLTNIPLTDRGVVCGPTDTGRGAVESYYDDGGNNPLHDCTGDNRAYGTFGFRLLTDACTDRLYANSANNSCPGNNEEFVQFRYHYYLPPNATTTEAQGYADFAKNPLTVSTGTIACGGSPGINVGISELAAISCNGASDGSLQATASGGSGNYIYAWSNGASTATVSGLAANTYGVTATDTQSGNTATASRVLTQPSLLSVSTTSTNETNGQANGTATATAAGGTSPYQYLWSTTATTPTIGGLAAGTYQVTVTDDRACTASAAVVITNEVTGACSFQLFDLEPFEVDFGQWNDGGSNCSRINPPQAGSFVVQLRNGTSTSRVFSNAFDFSTDQELRVNFDYGASSMESGEQFELNISLDGGSNFSNIRSWESGVDFGSSQQNVVGTATYSGPLSTGVVLEFRNRGNQNNDRIFLDNVEIERCGTGQNRRRTRANLTKNDALDRWLLAPNPVRELLHVHFPSVREARAVRVSIIDNRGRLVREEGWLLAPGEERREVAVSDLIPGLYWLRVAHPNGGGSTQKFVVLP